MRLFLQCLFALTLLFAANGASATSQHHSNILSLDGTWQIIFDHENKGKQQKLFKNKPFLNHEDIRNIEVPSVWERIEKDYEGVAIYRKSFDAPKDWDGSIVHLAFDAVNYRAEVYVNDEVVGVHEGGFTPFRFRVDTLLHYGKENIITLRVLGPILLDTDKVIDGMGAMETPQWRGAISGGIWQSVRLISSHKNYIDDVFIEPNIDKNKAKITLELLNYDEFYSKDELHLIIRDIASGKTINDKKFKIKLQPGINTWSGELKVPNAKYWSPDTPHLYSLEAKLTDKGAMSDSVKTRFGMREFTIKDKRFYLNGKEIYVKAVFLEGVYPVGLASAVDMDLARQEIRLTKEAGFNMIRPWRRPPPPEWLDLADEMGIMIIGSPALECMDLPVNTPDLPGRVINEIGKTIKRDRNRASIVMWELYNELRRPVLKQMMAETAMQARDLDPSRLILDESGGWAYGAKVYLPYSRDFQYFNDVHTYPGPAMTNLWYDKFLGVAYSDKERKKKGIQPKPIGRNVKNDITSFISELGYGSYPDFSVVNRRFEQEGNPIVPPTRYHKKLEDGLTTLLKNELSDIYETPQAFYLEQQHIHGLANARMIEAARANKRVTGYCVHALTGGDWIMGAGLLDLWREPKKEVYERTKAANAPRILTIRSWGRNIYQGAKMRFTVQGINDLDDIKGKLQIAIIAPNGKKVWKKDKSVKLTRYVNALMDENVRTKNWNGEYKIEAKLIGKRGKIIAQNSYDFAVFPPLKKAQLGKIAIIDKTGALKRYMEEYEIEHEPFTSKTNRKTPVLVATKMRKAKSQEALNEQLTAFIKKGGKVLYLQFPITGPRWHEGILSKGYSMNTPIDVRINLSTGLWAGMTHVVPNHEIFNGLPQKRAMYGVYENIRAKYSMIDHKGKNIVKVVANENFPDMNLANRHYIGPGSVWLGSDLVEKPQGRGTLWLSTMQLIPHLTQDPAADLILNNLLTYITNK